MSDISNNLTINERLLKSDFEELSKIGEIDRNGVNRPVFSQAHLEARKWFRQKVNDANLEFRQDGAGNHSACLNCGPENASTLLLGSHLDSVPNGGRYDGTLGVLAALEVLRTISRAGLRLPVNLEAIDFSDEEGTLVSFLGSFALTGKLTPENLRNPRGGRENFLQGLKRAALTEKGLFSARRAPESLSGYLELHIEQGPRLEKSGHSIGIVDSIAGLAFYRLNFIGRADHAGTISMQERLDSAQGASAFTLAAREITLRDFPTCKTNVGYAVYSPGAFNIVPQKAEIAFECRAADLNTFQEMENVLIKKAHLKAERYGLDLQVEFLGKRNPIQMAPTALNTIQEAANMLGLSSRRIISWAGHDAQALAEVCPTGMIFVPSVGGTSHSPDEFTEWEDCVNGANVLLQAAISFASCQ